MSRLTSRTRFSVLAIGLAVAAGVAVWSTHSAIVRAEPAAPAATAPSTQPATKPAADAKADEVTAVAKGTIDLRLDLDAVLAPVDPCEVKIRTKVYQGELQIIAVAAQGDKVKKGDVVLAIDPKLLKRQLASAEAEMANLQAASEKALADAKLGEAGDAIELQRAQDGLRYAQDNVKWWDDNDSKMELAALDINDKITNFYIENSTDELDQLKKMYKSEDLTSDTADIVMKRANRILDIYTDMKVASGYDDNRVRNYMMKQMREQFTRTVDSAKQSLDQVQVAQKQQQVTRKTAVDLAAIAVETATDKLGDLRKEADALTVKSDVDGTVVYGSFRNNAWVPTPPETLKVGEKISAQQVLMTVVAPGKLKAMVDLPESKLAYVSQGAKAKIRPTAFSDLSYDSTVDRIDVVGANKGSEQSFQMTLPLGDVDARLMPGFKASATFDGGKLSDVLVVPIAAVSKGRVWVRNSDGKDEPRDVVLGKADGTNVDIKSGLAEGEKVLKQAKK